MLTLLQRDGYFYVTQGEKSLANQTHAGGQRRALCVLLRPPDSAHQAQCRQWDLALLSYGAATCVPEAYRHARAPLVTGAMRAAFNRL